MIIARKSYNFIVPFEFNLEPDALCYVCRLTSNAIGRQIGKLSSVCIIYIYMVYIQYTYTRVYSVRGFAIGFNVRRNQIKYCRVV